MNPRPGLMLNSDICLVRQIGEGGMGSVWQAKHLPSGTEVAVKFMTPELAKHRDSVVRFAREAKAAMRMQTAHSVKVFGHGTTDDGVPFMTMELLVGEDLEERVWRGGPLSLCDAVDVVTQLAGALAEAHSLGIVHRDVNAKNVFLLNRSGSLFVKVLDFGIAKESGALVNVTCSGITLGTPKYMSPEQIVSAKNVDARCDLWSMGIIAYLCLTGTVPFEGATYGAMCISIDKGKVAPPSTLRAGLPPAVDAWFAKALNRDISRRFQTAKQMSDAFAEAVLGKPEVRKPRRSWLRRPRLLAPAAAFALIAVSATGFGHTQQPGAREARDSARLSEAPRAQPAQAWHGPSLHTAPAQVVYATNDGAPDGGTR